MLGRLGFGVAIGRVESVRRQHRSYDDRQKKGADPYGSVPLPDSGREFKCLSVREGYTTTIPHRSTDRAKAADHQRPGCRLGNCRRHHTDARAGVAEIGSRNRLVPEQEIIDRNLRLRAGKRQREGTGAGVTQSHTAVAAPLTDVGRIDTQINAADTIGKRFIREMSLVKGRAASSCARDVRCGSKAETRNARCRDRAVRRVRQRIAEVIRLARVRGAEKVERGGRRQTRNILRSDVAIVNNVE